MDTARRECILAEARTWLGTPYHHKGRIKKVGVDCGGLLYEVYGKYYPIKPFPDTYAPDWSLHRGLELYLDFISEYVLEISEPQPADIVVFRYGRCYSHGGIWTERNTVIHAWGRDRYGRVLESSPTFFREGRMPRPHKFYTLRNP